MDRDEVQVHPSTNNIHPRPPNIKSAKKPILESYMTSPTVSLQKKMHFSHYK
jgi:hypothetical protein